MKRKSKGARGKREKKLIKEKIKKRGKKKTLICLNLFWQKLFPKMFFQDYFKNFLLLREQPGFFLFYGGCVPSLTLQKRY